MIFFFQYVVFKWRIQFIYENLFSFFLGFKISASWNSSITCATIIQFCLLPKQTGNFSFLRAKPIEKHSGMICSYKAIMLSIVHYSDLTSASAIKYASSTWMQSHHTFVLCAARCSLFWDCWGLMNSRILTTCARWHFFRDTRCPPFSHYQLRLANKNQVWKGSRNNNRACLHQRLGS